ncbi:hypothetical protein BU197_12980 [Streptomyces sp. CBMA291]|nr:hypothetical protein [Streptomyces sp. CBMA291]
MSGALRVRLGVYPGASLVRPWCDPESERAGVRIEAERGGERDDRSQLVAGLVGVVVLLDSAQTTASPASRSMRRQG